MIDPVGKADFAGGSVQDVADASAVMQVQVKHQAADGLPQRACVLHQLEHHPKCCRREALSQQQAEMRASRRCDALRQQPAGGVEAHPAVRIREAALVETRLAENAGGIDAEPAEHFRDRHHWSEPDVVRGWLPGRRPAYCRPGTFQAWRFHWSGRLVGQSLASILPAAVQAVSTRQVGLTGYL